MKMRAIRWVSFMHNFNCGPEDINVDALSLNECLDWELNPNREVSVELLPESTRHTYCIVYGAIGLEVDIEKSVLIKAFATDANTIPEAGKLIPDDRNHSTADSWEECSTLWQSIPKNKRQGWSEVVISSPVYKAVVYRTDDDMLDDENIKNVANILNLPIRRIRSRTFNMDD